MLEANTTLSSTTNNTPQQAEPEPPQGTNTTQSSTDENTQQQEPEPPKAIQGQDVSIPLSPQGLLAKSGEAKPGNVDGGYELGPYPGHTTKFDGLKVSTNGESSNDTVVMPGTNTTHSSTDHNTQQEQEPEPPKGANTTQSSTDDNTQEQEQEPEPPKGTNTTQSSTGDNTQQHEQEPEPPKAIQGQDVSIPLSPQWLLAKYGEAKPGSVDVGSELGPFPGHTSKFDGSKVSTNGESSNDTDTKKDVFIPSVFNRELGRHGCWHDEERDTSRLPRRERQREDRDSKDRRKIWGEEDKDSKDRRKNWDDPNRNFATSRDKGPSHLNNNENKDYESDYRRPWRPRSYFNHERGEPDHQILTPHSETAYSGHNENHRENPPALENGRPGSEGNIMTSTSSPRSSSIALNKVQGDLGKYSPSRYSRTQLLDVYRNKCMSFTKPVDGFIGVPSLTQEESRKPLALCAPTSEEMVILKEIRNGNLISSDTSQVPEDESFVRNSTSMVPSRRNKLEDFPRPVDYCKDETSDSLRGAHYSEAPSYEKDEYQYGFDPKPEGLRPTGVPHMKPCETVNGQKRSGTLWGSHTVQKQSNNSSCEVWPRECHLSQTQQKKKFHDKCEVSEGYDSDLTRDSTKKRQPYDVLERDRYTKQSSLQGSPEELLLYYNDPQGQIRGPFSSSDLIGWWEDGFFGLDLEVRPAGASSDAPFSTLGDVIPRLRAKASPPPGYIVPKTMETEETVSRSKFRSHGKLHAIPSETLNELTDRNNLLRAGENAVLQSLMSSNMNKFSLENLAFPKGLQEDAANSSDSKLAIGIGRRNELNSMLVQKLLLEQQTSLPSSHLLADVPLKNVNLTSILQGIGGTHQQTLQSDHRSLISSMAQSLSHSSSSATMENLLSSVLLQDPNIIKIVQEQQQQVLLEQQRKLLHEQQQQLLQLLLQQQLLRQQEQHKFSQVLPDLESIQRIDEPSTSHMPEVVVPVKNVPVINRGLCAPHEMFQAHSQVAERTSLDTNASHRMFQAGCQMPAPTSQDESAPHVLFHKSSRLSYHTSQEESSAGFVASSTEVSKDVGKDISFEAPAPSLPHQFFESTSHQETWEATLPGGYIDIQNKDLLAPSVADCISSVLDSNTSKVLEEPQCPIEVETTQGKSESREHEPIPWQDCKIVSGHQVWKPAPGVKAKSLLDMQQLENHRTQTQMTTSGIRVTSKRTGSSPTWNAGVSNLEPSLYQHIRQDAYLEESRNTQNIWSNESHLHTNPEVGSVDHWGSESANCLPPQPQSTTSGKLSKAKPLRDILKEQEQMALSIRRTTSKKTPKKVHSYWGTHGSGPIQMNAYRSAQPNYGVEDETSWGSHDQSNSESVEQTAPKATSENAHFNWKTCESGSTQEIAECSPSWAKSSFHLNDPATMATSENAHFNWETCESGSTQEIVKCSSPREKSSFHVDDPASVHSNLGVGNEIFWGPLDTLNLESKLETRGSAIEGVQAGLSAHQNSILAGDSLSSSCAAAQLSQKGSKDTTLKHSEANEFRAWCETEIMRLTGSNDTSVLEFCLKEPTSEAEAILKDNFSVKDPDHKFIDTFLNHKENLSAEVIEIAFQSHIDWNSSVLDGGHSNTIVMGSQNTDPNLVEGQEGGFKVVGKKKGKKGSRFNSSLLGFTVCSNRFLAGEIQTAEN